MRSFANFILLSIAVAVSTLYLFLLHRGFQWFVGTPESTLAKVAITVVFLAISILLFEGTVWLFTWIFFPHLRGDRHLKLSKRELNEILTKMERPRDGSEQVQKPKHPAE